MPGRCDQREDGVRCHATGSIVKWHGAVRLCRDHAPQEAKAIEVTRWNGEAWEWHGEAELTEDGAGNTIVVPGEGVTGHEAGQIELAHRKGHEQVVVRGVVLRWEG